MQQLSFGSLFAGIGGIDLGLERVGMRCAWQIEIDDYATKVLQKHWPDVARFRDVRECGAHNLEPVDVLAGGFPCQPHSLAGKRAASADERDLWGEFARIIGELRPRWVVAENVPGLLSSEDGRFFGGVLRDLATRGYDAEWQSIPAAAVGAPHRRDRIFILAYPNSERGEVIGHTNSWDGRTLAAQTRELAGSGSTQHVAHTAGERVEGYRADRIIFPPAQIGEGLFRRYCSGPGANQWAVEPDMGRVANGVPSRVDRLTTLGNAVVPQVAEFVGRCIVEAADAA